MPEISQDQPMIACHKVCRNFAHFGLNETENDGITYLINLGNDNNHLGTIRAFFFYIYFFKTLAYITT